MQRPSGFRGIFRTDDVARALYSEGAGIFRIVPAAVAVPVDVEDVVRLVRWAGETGHPLVPRGAGSGMPGGNVGPGVVVDLTRAFRDAPVVDAERRTARAGASVTYRELDAAAAKHGLRLPPDPSSGAFCTLGGMVSTNAAGAHSFKYGAMRQWVEAVEFITADGETGRAGREDLPPEVLTAAERRLHADVAPRMRQIQLVLEHGQPSTHKNSSGYQLARLPDDGWIRHLLIGSEGTLAIVTAVEVRLSPVPPTTITLLVPVHSLDVLGIILDSVLKASPSAVELLDRTYLEFARATGARIPAGSEAALIVELDDEDGFQVLALLGVGEGVVVAGGPEETARIWELRHLASPILAALPDNQRSLQVIEDGCVPRERLGDYIAGLRRVAAAHGFQIVIFGHAGDGHVHANLLADVAEPDVVERVSACLLEVSDLQMGHHGTLSGEHGDGRLRAPLLQGLLGRSFLDVCRRVKAAFDPAGILNPGVKIAEAGARVALAPELLKFGARAPALPREVAEVLRRIERDAAWGTFRLDLAPEAAPAHP